MKTFAMTVGFALFTALGVSAQGTTDARSTTTPQKGDRHTCIMASADTWTKLGLSADQINQVKEVQGSCAKEHAAAKGDEAMASVARHEEKLKGILTPEQYTQWSQWCAEQAAAKPQTGTTK